MDSFIWWWGKGGECEAGGGGGRPATQRPEGKAGFRDPYQCHATVGTTIANVVTPIIGSTHPERNQEALKHDKLKEDI